MLPFLNLVHRCLEVSILAKTAEDPRQCEPNSVERESKRASQQQDGDAAEKSQSGVMKHVSSWRVAVMECESSKELPG